MAGEPRAREKAQESLRYFREEITANQKAVQTVRQYHEKLLQDLQRFAASNEPKTLDSLRTDVRYAGMQPVNFERTALDLALANQSLSYLSPQLAYAISRVYTKQQMVQSLQNGFLQSAFTPGSFASHDATGLIISMEIYLIDVNIQEPQLLRLYRDLLPQIGAADSR